jgi:hypothetical protein
MASEDSDELVPGLASVHRLGDTRDLDETLTGQMSTVGHHPNAARELLEVVPLSCDQRIPLEERDDDSEKLVTPTNDVPIEVLTMVVVPLVREDLPHTEEVVEPFQGGETALSLRYGKLVRHLVAGRIASSPRTVWLPHEADREASFSVYETDHPATELAQSFLLVFRTRHVVTMVYALSDVTR